MSNSNAIIRCALTDLTLRYGVEEFNLRSDPFSEEAKIHIPCNMTMKDFFEISNVYLGNEQFYYDIVVTNVHLYEHSVCTECGHVCEHPIQPSIICSDCGMPEMGDGIVEYGYCYDKDGFEYEFVRNAENSSSIGCVFTGIYGDYFDSNNVVIPLGVTEIRDFEARGRWYGDIIEGVTLPYGVKRIDDNAFADFRILEKINIPSSVIGNNNIAIKDCNSFVKYGKQHTDINGKDGYKQYSSPADGKRIAEATSGYYACYIRYYVDGVKTIDYQVVYVG